MQWIDWILFIIAVIAGMLVLRFVLSKAKKLTLLDLDAMPKAKVRSKKYQIIENRLKRKTKTIFGFLDTMMKPVKEQSKNIYKKLVELEHKYRRADHAPKTDQEKEQTRSKIAQLFDEGRALFKAEKFTEAEQIFLDIIRISPKEVEAFEYLGEIYIERKEYDHAIETLRFAMELNPNDDRIFLDLGTIYQEQGNLDKAVENLKKCVEIAPNNPRNLDALLKAGIQKKDRVIAKETFRKLQEVDPDNGKLKELEEAVKAI